MKKLLLTILSTFAFFSCYASGYTAYAPNDTIKTANLQNTGAEQFELTLPKDLNQQIEELFSNNKPETEQILSKGIYSKGILSTGELEMPIAKSDEAPDYGIYSTLFTEENTIGNSNFGTETSAAGDFNGDGYPDWMISAPYYKNDIGRVYVYFGGYEPDTIPDLIIDGENPGDNFGISLAPAGDINNDGYDDILIGSFRYRSYTGKAYVYYGGPSPDNVPDIHLDGFETNDNFGYSLAGAGDINADGYNDIIIGAPYAGYNNRGVVYIYYGGVIADNTPDIYLYGNTDGASFGYSVSSAGDFDRDGFDDVIVGNLSYSEGKVQLFFGSQFMDNIADLVLEDASELYFGLNIAKVGDVNHDGYDDVAVGAHYSNYSRGKVVIYYGGYTPNNVADVTLTGENPNNYFGNTIAGAGDVNNDGYDDILVSASGAGTQGMVYIFLGDYDMDNVADMSVAGNPSTGTFGYAISPAGDVNNDGYDDIIIGAYNYNSGTGAAFLYQGSFNMDNLYDLLLVGQPTLNLFGKVVASAGDVNNDGYNDIIVGAENYNRATGRAYIYYGGAETDNVADVILQGEGTLSWFGSAVSAAGDINNDGYDDVIVAADKYNNYSGAVYVFFGGAQMDNHADLRIIGEKRYDYFGLSVSGNGDINNDGYDDFIVGTGNYDSKGKAYVYFGGKNPDNIADLVFEGETTNTYFGSVVAFVGDVNHDNYDDICIGAQHFSFSTGKTYLYYGSQSPDNVADIVYNGEAEYSNFGSSISSAGDINNDGFDDLLISANGYNNSSGKVYLYLGGTVKDNIADLTYDAETNYERFGSCISPVGDINSDGFDDIIIGALNYKNKGRAYVYYGNDTLDNAADIVFDPLTIYNENFAISVAGAGDVDNDGREDIIIGAYTYPVNGAVYLYQGVDDPVITTQPENQHICKKHKGNFWLTAAGNNTIGYQWQLNSGSGYANITDNEHFEGSRTNNLKIASAEETMDGYRFRCLIGNDLTSIISESVLLAVDQPATTAKAGENFDICGKTGTLNANSPTIGTGEWTTNGNALFSNPNNYNTEVSNLDAGDNFFTWKISNGACCTDDLVVITSFEEIEANAGEDVQLCDQTELVLSANNPEPGYGIWSTDNPEINFANAANNNTTISNLPDENFVLIWTITNGLCNSGDEVEINPGKSIQILENAGVTSKNSGAVQITFKTDGDVLSYQWRKDGQNLEDGENISGANTNKLIINNLTSEYTGNYDCLISGNCNELITNAVLLSLTSAFEETMGKGINIYPNPTDGLINLEFDDFTNIKALEIYTLSGKKIIQKNAVNRKEMLDLRAQNEGTYFIVIQKENEIIKSKLVIQK